MTTNRGARAVATLLAGILIAGCGGAPDETPSDSPDTAASADATARDACALIEVAEIEAISGKRIATRSETEADGATSCELRDAETETDLVYVTVYWTGGRQMAQVERDAMGMASQLLDEPGLDMEELTGSGDEPGLADEAYYSDIMPSWVLEGDVMIQVVSPLFNADQTRRTFLAIATTALSRL